MVENARKLPVGVGAVMLLVTTALGPNASTVSALEAGGHVGVALPLVTLSKDTTNFIDDTVIATPLGIGLKLTDTFTLDFESVVFTPMVRGGRTSLMVDPGLIYHAGPVNLGLRVAFQIGQPSNIGAIPLINVPLVKMEHATWFVEGAFPIFYMDKRLLTTYMHIARAVHGLTGPCNAIQHSRIPPIHAHWLNTAVPCAP